MTTAAIIVAAGRGHRAGAGLPKQWRPLAGRTVIEHTLRAFDAHPRIDHIVVVLHPQDMDAPPLPSATGFETGFETVAGGATRSASVQAGLERIEGRFDQVLIHDAARPCVPPELIDRVLDALADAPGAAPALAVVDALWSGSDGTVTGTLARNNVFRAQTPQGFDLGAILSAYRATPQDAPAAAADDVAIARAAGLTVAIVPGDERNLKITLPEDFARAEQHLGVEMDIRLGNGFDVHRFGPGDHVTLCGVKIAHDQGLVGHSDADVGMHAVTDAIYGALASGDIGTHFPPSDPQWKGAASHIFLAHAAALAQNRGYTISHVDCTLICEFPKIGPHAERMRAVMAETLRLSEDRVSVKATTSERLGFTGRGEGIAALATATLVSP